MSVCVYIYSIFVKNVSNDFHEILHVIDFRYQKIIGQGHMFKEIRLVDHYGSLCVRVKLNITKKKGLIVFGYDKTIRVE